MLFNSFEFLVFFVATTVLYFLFPYKGRWLLLLLASCFFYMFFKPVYILILAFTIVIDYAAGILIENTNDKKRKKQFLIASLVVNIGVLAIFKYYNFLNDQITGLASLFGYTNQLPYLNILLPIGLSFHTFQAMSYTIEVYRGNQSAEKHFGVYALYVMFYPQLVAGPIERPQNMLHQFHEEKRFNYENLFLGLQWILWGLFKKVVIADRLALMVDFVYKEPSQWHGLAILITVVLFGIQIYCDFSGYSDIALGAAKVMGFNLMVNFNRPYSSASFAEFWRRWHISLSSWFRDYVYIPLGGNKQSKGKWYYSLLVVFLLSGIWHGANWTFVIWGMLHFIYIVSENKLYKRFGWLKNTSSQIVIYCKQAVVFILVNIAWVFFRSGTVKQAFDMLKNMIFPGGHNSYFTLSKDGIHGLPSAYLGLPFWQFTLSLLLIPALFLLESIMSQNNSKNISTWPVYLRWGFYYCLIFSIFLFGVFETRQFIYFQF